MQLLNIIFICEQELLNKKNKKSNKHLGQCPFCHTTTNKDGTCPKCKGNVEGYNR